MLQLPDRQQQRQQLLQRRTQLSPQQQHSAARSLCRNLITLPCYRASARIALYLAADGEIDTAPIIGQAQQDGKQVFVPVLDKSGGKRMCFQRLLPGQQLQRNCYVINEPVWDPAQQLPPAQLDLILLPLVGFDAHGGRLGMGGGYYDRALAGLHAGAAEPLLIGLAHACQQVDRLQLQPWDVPLDAVITDEGRFLFRTDLAG